MKTTTALETMTKAQLIAECRRLQALLGAKAAAPAVSADFASSVLAAAAAAPASHRFGSKVFISWIIQSLPGTAAEIKARIVAEQRAGRLNLSRCDLVEAFPAEIVRDSECCYLSASFHFVRL